MRRKTADVLKQVAVQPPRMACAHELDSEYLTPTDSAVTDIRGSGEDFRIDVVVPCPDCGQALELTLKEERREEVDVDFPLDDAEIANS